jgi:hypothetical protein
MSVPEAPNVGVSNVVPVQCLRGAHRIHEDFGTFLSTAGAYGTLPRTETWVGNNLAPSTKRGTILIWWATFDVSYSPFLSCV